jgi:hypothetical protein
MAKMLARQGQQFLNNDGKDASKMTAAMPAPQGQHKLGAMLGKTTMPHMMKKAKDKRCNLASFVHKAWSCHQSRPKFNRASLI